MRACRVCGNERGNRAFQAREMMFGFRDAFEYTECAVCGCLQISEVPFELSKYYPAGYYSYGKVKEPGRIRRHAIRQRFLDATGERHTWLGRLLARRYGTPPLADWARQLRLRSSDAVLDIGCGSGALLVEMNASGFTNLTGLDPFIEHDLEYRCGVRVLKRGLYDYKSTCDSAMMHHTFEHLVDPMGTMEQLSGIVAPGGSVLIRMPVAGTHAWRTYGADWYQLDAPRHLFVHTEESLAIIARRAGFEIAGAVYDSTGRQFWVSEQYRRDIPMNDERSYLRNPKGSVFTPEDIEKFDREAERLNAERQGDQACFCLRKT